MGTASAITDLESPLCPICGATLFPQGRRRLDCPGCGKTLVAAQSSVYQICRRVGIYAVAAIWAWKRGWDPWGIVFVVSFYVFPVLWLWNIVEREVYRMYPPKRFEPPRTPFQTLGI